MAGKIALDLKEFKHVSSDHKTTKLKHKNGHFLVLSHKSLSPEAQKQLGALSKVSIEAQTANQAQEKQLEQPKMMAEGGSSTKELDEEPKTFLGIPLYGSGPSPKPAPAPAPPDPQKSKDVSDVFRKAEGGEIKRYAHGGETTSAYDAGLPCLNPHCKSHGKPHPNCRCYSGGEAYAKGGEVSRLRYCAHGKPHMSDCSYARGGVSEQGKDVRHGHKQVDPDQVEMSKHFAKEEAKGRAQHERTIKPNIKGLADGGRVMMKEGGAPLDPVEDADTDEELKNSEAIAQNEADPNRTLNGAADAALQEQQQQPQQDQQQGLAVAPPQQQAPVAEAPKQIQPDQSQGLQSPQPTTEKPKADNYATPMDNFEIAKQNAVANNKQDLIKENQAWQQDLANGHITPKTYQDLFASKSTLGKVGTLFGLLLSGAGSGLSGQPSTVLSMMDKEIQRDLEAQIQSKTNAKNFITLNQQALMNQANVRQLDTDSLIKSYALSQSQMLQSTYHQLSTDVAKMPEGPAKEIAKQNLGMVYNAIGTKINNINDLAVGASAYYNTMFPKAGQSDQSEEAWQQDNFKKRMMGPQGEAIAQQQADKHVPGIQGYASKPLTEGDRARIDAHNVLDNKINDVMSYVKQHSNIKDQFNPQVIKEAAQKAHELTAFYNKTVDNLGMTSGRMDWLEDQIKKNPQSLIQQLMGNNAVLNEIKNSNNTRKDLFLNKTLGFPPQQRKSAPAMPAKLQDGTTGIEKGTNKPIIFRNGTWTYK